MNYDLGLFVVAFLLTPFAVIFWQMILNRAAPGQSGQKLTMVSMVLGYPTFFMFVYFLPFSSERNFAFFTYMFLLYSFAAYTYFHIFNMSETSRRIRMINRIGNSVNPKLESLKDLYNADDMLNVRLHRLVALNQIVNKDARYFPKGRLFPTTAAVLYCVGLAVDRPWPELRSFKQDLKNDKNL